jgi:hypothetical protein
MGHDAGLYRLLAHVPGFASVRAPVNIWFVPALGLALLAGSGLMSIVETRRWRLAAAALVVVTGGDLFHRNYAANPLAYARASYVNLYWPHEDQFRTAVALRLPPLTRFDAPFRMADFGPLNHPLNVRAETTYGYTPLVPLRYQEYMDASTTNPRLLDALNVSMRVDPSTRSLQRTAGFLPRANFPNTLTRVRTRDDELAALATLEPAAAALVPAAIDVTDQDGSATADTIEIEPGRYRIRYRAASRSVLRVGNSWFPGWRATLAGRNLELFPIDHALTGIVVPPGDGEIDLEYRPRYFTASALASVVALIGCLVVLVGRRPAGHVAA